MSQPGTAPRGWRPGARVRPQRSTEAGSGRAFQTGGRDEISLSARREATEKQGGKGLGRKWESSLFARRINLKSSDWGLGARQRDESRI